MNVVAELFAVITGALHLWVFAMESVLFRDPRVQEMFEVRPEEVSAVRLWAFHQGIYNLFFALAALGGVVLTHLDDGAAAGRALVLFACGSMLLASLALFAADPRRRRVGGLIGQGAPALLALIAIAVRH